MSYLMYTTPALVCGSKDNNTSDRSYLLFTRDAGMVWATARSVREERSKQRYALQDHSLIRVSLVRGKQGWRIGSVESIMNAYLTASHRAGRSGVVGMVRFLRRFVHGEWPHPELFTDIETVLPQLAVCTDVKIVEKLRTVFEARALYALGYMARSEEIATLLPPVLFKDAQDNSMIDSPKLAKQLMHAHEASHL